MLNLAITATCPFVRMTGIFHVSTMRQRRGGTDNEIKVQKVDSGEDFFSRRSCRDSNPRPVDHESGALSTELSRPKQLDGLHQSDQNWSSAD